MQEIWRDIYYYQEATDEWFDYRGKYQVSNLGRVRNTETGRILTPTRRNSEHKYVCVHIKKNCFRVHRLVAFMFSEICGEWFKGATVDHIDENPTNNVATNLRWLDMDSNLRSSSTRCPKPIIQYTLNKEFVREWNSINQAARELGKAKKSIRKVCRGEASQCGGFIWRYKRA